MRAPKPFSSLGRFAQVWPAWIGGKAKLPSNAGYIQQVLQAYSIPYFKYKPQRATMVFPMTGELERCVHRAIASCTAVSAAHMQWFVCKSAHALLCNLSTLKCVGRWCGMVSGRIGIVSVECVKRNSWLTSPGVADRQNSTMIAGYKCAPTCPSPALLWIFALRPRRCSSALLCY